VNGGIHSTTLNGSTASYANNFWNFDFSATTVSAGQTSSYFDANGNSLDCYSVSLAGLYFQTTTCTTCVATALTLNKTSNSSLCGSCNGSASVTATGGTSPYTYTWSNGSTTQTASSLCSGTFTVTVKDNSGCSSTTSMTITTSPSVSASVPALANVLCQG